ncbi:hypothetical protein PHLGIDRAFT_130825, partial [Phlebiopsis gigantea 11061_1 CR5-6]
MDPKENQALPAYEAHDRAADPPPAYTPPTSFAVGAQTLASPLVHVQELKAHLALLGAFKQLRTAVEEAEAADWPPATQRLGPAQRWAWFVGLAVDRFTSWVKVVRLCALDVWVEQDLPPLDVLMIWHAYMLNPTWYAEDCTRMRALNTFRVLRDRLLLAIVRVGDISSYVPSAERQERWAQQTGTPWDPLAAAPVMESVTVACPKCLAGVSVPYLTETGTGYLQSNFEAVCPGCKFGFKKENLAVLKFARDLVLDHRNSKDKQKYGLGVYLAGTVRTTTQESADYVGSLLNLKLHAVFPPPGDREKVTKDEWTKSIMAKVTGMDKLWAQASPAFRGVTRRSRRVFSAYTDDRPFSVDLVGAVIRQGSFIDKMHLYGWTEPGAFDKPEDEVVLQHAIARYHAFLDLMATSPGAFYVPTLDIDLAWHTHQMKGEMYQDDCKKYIQRYVDHDDKVEESHLATSFDITCRAWEARYQVPYTHCGCPLPGDTLGQRLARLKRRLSIAAAPDPTGL